MAPVEREKEREELVRVRVGTGGVKPRGVVGRSCTGEATEVCVSPPSVSVHWRWRMTDFVAH